MRRKPKRRNLDSSSPVRSMRVSEKLWDQLEVAAGIAGVSRREFILTVCGNAAQQIILASRKQANEEREAEYDTPDQEQETENDRPE